MPHETMPGPGRTAAATRQAGNHRPVALVVGDGPDEWMLPDEPFLAAGCTPVRAKGFDAAIAKCSELSPDLVFLPLTVDGRATSHHLRQCLAGHPAPVVVVIASNEQINTAAEAMRAGAYDCLFKPFSQARLTRTVEGAMRQLRQTPTRGSARASRRLLRATPQIEPGGPVVVPSPALVAPHLGPEAVPDLRLARRGFVAGSPPMRALMSRATAVAASDAPIFISGEVGTGKTTLAQILHDASLRAAGPLVTVDCATLSADTFTADLAGPDGALARAAGGTLFFDEIGDLRPELQSRLLRLIDMARASGPSGDVRFIAATGRDPRDTVREGLVRPDLFYRLHVAPIVLPPLRVRDGDLALIARTRLAAFSEAEGRGFVGFSDAAMAMLVGYDWPGNLRELVNVIWTLVLMNEGPLVTPELLPAEIRGGRASLTAPGGSPRHGTAPEADGAGIDALDHLIGRPLAEIERAVIEATIRAEDGSVPRAARVLDVSPSTLYRKREAWSNTGKT